MTTKVPVAVLEETLQRSVDGLNSLSDTLNSILAVVAAHGDADLRREVNAIMARRRELQRRRDPQRVDFADLDFGDVAH